MWVGPRLGVTYLDEWMRMLLSGLTVLTVVKVGEYEALIAYAHDWIDAAPIADNAFMDSLFVASLAWGRFHGTVGKSRGAVEFLTDDLA